MCCCSQGGDGDRALAALRLENNEAHTQTPARTHGQVDHDDDSRDANFNTPVPEALYSNQIAWKRGYELPPFAAPAQPEVEALLRSIYIAKVGERTLKVGVTQATALQLYQLLCSRAAQPVAATSIHHQPPPSATATSHHRRHCHNRSLATAPAEPQPQPSRSRSRASAAAEPQPQPNHSRAHRQRQFVSEGSFVSGGVATTIHLPAVEGSSAAQNVLASMTWVSACFS